jgi:hypothetical protein
VSRPRPLVAAGGMTLASAVIAAYDIATRPALHSLAAVVGYVLGGALVGVCWTMAAVSLVRARRSPK